MAFWCVFGDGRDREGGLAGVSPGKCRVEHVTSSD